ncbi:MAG: precorrin-3B C(17)-methyltransferase [Verrucomicrobia bacterium]|nr:precorrin-3B C(17)-methyltransferase [Verrucomicrobiota bacterium]
MESKGKLNLVSVGPGFLSLIPPLADAALRESDIVVGYKLYFTWIKSLIEGKEIHSFSLTQERERAQKAIACARSGKIVSLISSGDIGIYGMAPLVLEEMSEAEEFQLQVIPGVSAANSSAALLGSPLSHDFATLSLSDLLCPWEWIENRARHLAKADLVVALYNVQSQSRPDGIYRVLRILWEEKDANTWCGVVRNAFRPDQSVYLCSLAELRERQFDMLTTIIVGNRFTQRKGQFIYTPRGYNGWPQVNEREHTGTHGNARLRPVVRDSGRLRLASREQSETSPAAIQTDNTPNAELTADGQPPTANPPPVWVFSGTGDGNALVAELLGRGYRVIVSTASDYGAEIASIALPGVEVRSGRLGAAARRNQLQGSGAVAIVDATHPFADRISDQLIELAAELNIPYIRYERPAAVLPSSARQAPDMASAARLAIEIGQRIFLATGIKDLGTFLSQPDAEHRDWFLRITPDTGSLDLALKAGIPRSHICAMQGPFSTEFNIALWSAWKVDCVVTKESGETGVFSFKAEAAAKLGILLIVIKRPQLSYPVVTSDLNSVAKLLEVSLSQTGNTNRLTVSNL